MANVGRQIKRLRTSQSMTQDDLAEKLFVSRQTVSNYETGKSNPDLDMLVRIAQVFETDVNCLIYGPPVTPDRRREKRKAIILAAVTALLVLAVALCTPWVKNYTKQTFDAGPSMLLYWAGWPIVMGLAGWTVLELAGCFLGAKRPKGTYRKWVRWALLGLLLFYGAMAVPFLVWTVRCSLSLRHMGSVSSTFGFPLGLNHLWQSFSLYPGVFRAGFAGIGAGLWLTQREKQKPSES